MISYIMTRKTMASLFIFILLSLIITFPLILKPFQLTVAGKEEYFLSYILNWNIHALTHFPQKIFQVPFFYPLKNTLAFSDPLFTSSLIALPFVKLFQQPFLAYTINILLAFILNGFFTYLVVYKLSKNWLASLISGVLLSFSIGRIDSLEHLQVFTIYWIPLGLYFFLRRRFFLVAICFIFQILNTIFLGYAYVLVIGLFSLIYFLKKQLTKVQLLTLLKYFLLALLLVGIIFIPYLQVSKTWQYSRSLKDIFGGSAYFLDYFYPTQNSRLVTLANQLILKQPWPAYLGATISILGLLTLRFVSSHPAFLATAIISLSSLVLSFGSYFQLTRHNQSFPLPLPYLWAYYLIPGFKSMRVPQRWSHLALFGLALFIGLSLAKFFKKTKPLYQKLITILIIIFVLVEIRMPLFNQPVSTSQQIPPVYHWLAEQPSSVVVEIPAQIWVMKLSDQEITRLHYRSFIFQAEHRFVNGYSGFTPPNWMENINALIKFPQARSLAKLKQLGVNLVVLHHQDIDQLSQLDETTKSLSTIQMTLTQLPEFTLVYEDKQASVYKRTSQTHN